ncbi:Serine/threonine-protein kinase PrkC [Caprobacter fermentans]|uniref:non-specific serine/threonine protein kinase n=1 Tax=Caproicibacter fermentans TaxID=2576756 RepID=A0A6N8I4L4_9FIRM|nr:Stk1 family PASTA domain-containing Ser/Thr kinase [Caproicibacter fermentans]MVB12905.1 Serine/threonine-protein kinase PrkC [Caproicibacter fermentans]OCN02385.1 serine/threonine protein kinase [Clostridium sp. W14A]QNK41349.1 Stk1 family PASTA domain-containing Ser/Thr kinase [Caproicibacter fermentans]
MDKYTGKRLDGRYEIHELVGVGGMAVVYRAYDTIDDRAVAVKILKDEFLGNEEFIRRFKNESKAIAVLSHPNIVKVFDVSFGDRIQYIVEEYIDGITLKEYLDQQKRIKWKEAIHFSVQILRALQHAHEKGIVHRDIKPQNIMLLQDGTIKVTDFGIARFSRSETRTMTDKAIGSVHYIAPEQARGDRTDEKTDIYSVGVMLYEMLTGQLPFEADSAVSVAIMQLQTDPKPLRELNPSIPEGLEEITLKAMQKNPERRYQSAAEMLRDIEIFKRNPSTKFQYKYFIDEKPTKYIDAINSVRNNDQPNYNDNYDYEEEPDEEPARKKKPVAILIVAGIAAAFLIVTISFGVAALVHSLNSGPKDVTMPNYVSKNIDEVKNEINSDPTYSFTIKEEPKSDPTAEKGTILDQTPKAGTMVKENTTITLTVSSGGATITLDDYSGSSQADVEAALKKLNLDYKILPIASDTVDKGIVVRTEPPAKTEVTAGTDVINVYVSSGKDIQKIPVPNVAGQTVDDARKMITDAGLTVGTTKEQASDQAKGTVIETDPLNGVKVDQGTTVNLIVSSGPAQKKVTIYVQLPKNVSHDIVLRAYLGSDLNVTKTVNPSYNDVCQLEFTGTDGIQTLTITLDGSKYNIYSLNFDTGEGKLQWSTAYVEPTGSSSSSSEIPSGGSVSPSD